MIRVQDEIRNLHKKFVGARCVICGCGPSMDDVDLSKISGEYIIALNSAIVALSDHAKFPNAYWLYRDRRVARETIPHLPTHCRKLQIIAPHKGWVDLRDLIPHHVKSSFIWVYNQELLVHVRSVIEDALQLADFMGFREAYLVGVDHAVRGGKPYASMFKWKECYWYDPKKPVDNPKSLRSMVAGMEAVKKHIGELKVFNTSPLTPVQVWPFVDYKECFK